MLSISTSCNAEYNIYVLSVNHATNMCTVCYYVVCYVMSTARREYAVGGRAPMGVPAR